MMAFAVAALFFVRFWTKTKDRLFGAFAFAFSILAIERLLLLLIDIEDETRTYVYMLRLVGFIVIILAIVDKNRQR